jgi:hypothetical protein
MSLKKAKTFKLMVATGSFFVGILIYAATSAQTLSSAMPQPPTTSANPVEQPKPQYCPLPEKLIRNKDMLWGIDSNWKSFTPSFTEEIGTFTGAQWTGIHVGKIMCLYQGKNSFDFPISLEQRVSKLFFEPAGQNWNLHVEGYIICKSSNVYDCPFFEEKKETISPGEAYKSLHYTGPNAPVQDNRQNH